MRILFIYRINVDDPTVVGIKSKMEGQIKALEHSHQVDAVYLSNHAILLNGKELTPLDKNWYTNKLSKLNVFYKQFYKTIRYSTDLDSYDLVYIRYHALHDQIYSFIKEFKGQVVLEIPTYPYDKEFSSWWQKIQLFLDKRYRAKLSKHVSRIVHFGPHKEIHGVPTYRMTNGISISNDTLLADHKSQESLTMIAIGKWQYWHGLDRLIQGIGNYKGIKKIRLLVIGDGPYADHYKKLVQEEKLNALVEFFPSLDGKYLDSLLRQAHIGIGSLAHHRKELEEVSALKHRRYCLHGLPFILSSYDLDFPKSLNYSLEVPADESPINIQEAISFYENLPKGFPEVLSNYAKEKLSWEKKMNEFIASFSSNNN